MLNCVLIFLDMSGGELIVIALVALLVLGPQKMGDFARKAGKMMNEVKRVSSDFTNQFNDETNSMQNEVKSIRESLTDAANNIKDEFNKQKTDITNNLDPETLRNINEPSNDVYNVSQDLATTEPEPESKPDPESEIKDNTAEHSGTKDVSKEEPVDKNPSSKQENNTNP